MCPFVRLIQPYLFSALFSCFFTFAFYRDDSFVATVAHRGRKKRKCCQSRSKAQKAYNCNAKKISPKWLSSLQPFSIEGSSDSCPWKA
ncbi:hypothetical protein VIGAN_08241100 [Vigna angularis var. angularis]|uniref:Uncharacterized protein n=1 Tax=Vigna angularis var. angularis TaxID=157739 RepID=A0A0S3SS50_PHAAN|nr:hypothetical protein VIGAN_08241100 [Vigna angularis var. angularis]